MKILAAIVLVLTSLTGCIAYPVSYDNGPSQGEYRGQHRGHVLGKPAAELGKRGAASRVGMLFQQGALFSSLTVTENIALPLIEHAGLSRPDAEHLALVKLALAGLPLSSADKYPSSLSGGMVKRAALARALALDPDILFLDEPTAGLDPIGAAAFDQLILTLRDALGLSVFLVTHDLDTLYTITDRVAVLSQKRVLVAEPIKQVEDYDDPWIHEYFHGPRGRAAYEAATQRKEQ